MMELSQGSRLKETLQIAQKTEELNVGDEPCTYNTICEVVARSKSAEILWSKLIDIARALEISQDHVQKIKLEVNSRTATHESLFYDILESWRGSKGRDAKLATLLRVLERKGVKDCADALRANFDVPSFTCLTINDIKESTTWGDLSSCLKLQILETNVLFQGNRIELAKVIGDFDLCNIDGATFLKRAKEKPLTLVNKQVPDKLKYYISRSMSSRHLLQSEVFHQTSGEIFLIQGIERTKLTVLAKGKQTDTSRNQILQRRLTVQLILLEHENDFERICKLTPQPVHWIKFQNDDFKWVKSSGSVWSLQKYVCDSQPCFFECDLVSKIDQVLVISDTPGMGKTILLSNIANKILEDNPLKLVRFIILKEFVQELHEKEVTIDTIISLIADQSSDCELGKKFVENTLRTSHCTLMFDGFDEVLRGQVDTAMEILQTIRKNLKTVQIFVTTRPHLREELENSLNVLGYTILPFREEDQINFLQEFWEFQGIPNCSSKTRLAKSVLTALTSNMTDNERNIAGIPLQCRMLAETYLEDAKRCSEISNQGDEDCEDFPATDFVTSIFEMYEKHMNMRLQQVGKMENSFNAVKHVHMYYALELLFPDHATDKFQFLTPSSSDISKFDLCRLGILELTNLNEIRFVHRTFAEYLIAWFAVEPKMCEKSNYFLLYQLMSSTPTVDFLTLPTPESNNYTSQANESIKIYKFEFNFPVICYFINEFVKRKLKVKPVPNLKLYQHDPYIFHASATHNYLHGLLYVSNLITDAEVSRMGRIWIDWENTEEPNIYINLLLLTAKYADVEMMKSFCEQIDLTNINFKGTRDQLPYLVTPLHVAIQRGHYNLFEYLVNQYKSELPYLKYLLHFSVYDSLRDSREIVSNKKLIIELLLTKNRELLEERCSGNLTPLLQDQFNPKLVEYLITEGADINAVDKQNKTVLHKLIDNSPPPKPEVLHRIVQALSLRGFKHFNLGDWLHRAFEVDVDILDETLQLLHSNGMDFNTLNGMNRSVMGLAIKNEGKSVNYIRQLVAYGANWKRVTGVNETALHACASHGNVHVFKYFMESHEEDIDIINDWLETPLHRSVVSESQNRELLQRLLINAGANVSAIECDLKMTPFHQSFYKGKGLSLSIIKLMEKKGLLINSTIAAAALRDALSNKEIEPNGEFINVLEYLIQKAALELSHPQWNPWKFHKIQQKMLNIFEPIEVTSDLTEKLKQLDLLSECEFMLLKQKTNEVKRKHLFHIIQRKNQSIERFCLSLLSTNQIEPFKLLREALHDAERQESRTIFVTAPPHVNQLLVSNEISMMVLLTDNLGLTSKRINQTNTLGYYSFNFVSESRITSQSNFNQLVKKRSFIFVICREFTNYFQTRLEQVAPICKIVVLCKQSHIDNPKCRIAIFEDKYTWDDFSMEYLRRYLRFTSHWNHLLFADVFATPDVLKTVGTDAMQYRFLDIKFGHRVGRQTGIYLSKSIFHFICHDKLAFIGITLDELKQFTNLGQKIGRIGTDIESLHYIVCEKIDEFEEVCKGTSCNVHLIEHHGGSFMLIKTFGFDNAIKRFYQNPPLCENFPQCSCTCAADDLTVNFIFLITFFEIRTENSIESVVYSCKLKEILPKMQRLLKLHECIELFQFTRRYQHLVAEDSKPIQEYSIKPLGELLIGKMNNLLGFLHITTNEFKKLKLVAVKTLFPHFLKNVQITGLERFVDSDVLLDNNGSLIFSQDAIPWYFIAKLVQESFVEKGILFKTLQNSIVWHFIAKLVPEIFSGNGLLFKILQDSFEYQLIYASHTYLDSIEPVDTEAIETFQYSSASVTFFNFLEYHLSKESNLTHTIKPEISFNTATKWAHCCLCANHYNLFKLVVNFGVGANFFCSGKLVMLAVIYASPPIIELVVDKYVQQTKKDLKDIKLHCTDGQDLYILHVAALRGSYAVMQFLLTKLGVIDSHLLKNILKYCSVDTTYSLANQVDERKRIIELLINYKPSLRSERDEHIRIPLPIRNVHIELLTLLVDLGVNVHATDNFSNNLLHLCPRYMTPQDYDELIKYLYFKGNSKIFHTRNKNKQTPLQGALIFLEVLPSTFELFVLAEVDFNAKCERGYSVLDYAKISNRSANCLVTLERFGAKANNDPIEDV